MSVLCLETITPLFLTGADPRGEPELRAASIRGALRFWLRALLGGVIGDKDLDALRKAEPAVFGSTDTGASPVVVRIRNLSRGAPIPFSAMAWQAGTFLSFLRCKGNAERARAQGDTSWKLL
jgi:CRISPR-associated protein Cmr1